MRIKVVPYIQTTGDSEFKSLITGDFIVDDICKLFDEWHEKRMGGWSKFRNDDDVVIEFYPMYYVIIPPKKETIKLSIPKTINDFIDDTYRNNIQLYWGEWVIENFEPKQFIKVDEIVNYYSQLLGRIEKSFELT